MNFFSTISSASSQYLAPIRKRSQHFKPRDDLDDFLSSDLELSFASTVSISSPSRDHDSIAKDTTQDDRMDISPMPCHVARREPVHFSKPTARPRAYTSGARMFGQDLSNNRTFKRLNSGSKGSQRSVLPAEWVSGKPLERTHSGENLFAPSAEVASLPSDDAMDVDPAPVAHSAHLLSSPTVSAAPTITAFNMFHATISTPRLESPGAGAGQLKKRRSFSLEAVSHVEQGALSSPPPSSPQHCKDSAFLRISTNVPVARPSPIPHRVVLVPQYPAMDSEESPLQGLAPPLSRRVVSAMAPPTGLDMCDESFDGPEMSSPAQAYIRRQQVRTLRRRDGTEDFRPLTGASPLVHKEVSESPSAKFMLAGEDGLMRISPETLDALLDGAYTDRIAEFHVIDCRFDYEYNGGHVPGAVNINTTAGVEEFLLTQNRPKPCVSGDTYRKTVLVFHCEFSAKRAPTIAKHLRSKDRAMNHRVYPKIHYPEIYVLEGGYCTYYDHSSSRCQPQGYVTMDDPSHAVSRREDLDQFRKIKFGRTKSYAYGDLCSKVSSTTQQQQQQQQHNNSLNAALLLVLLSYSLPQMLPVHVATD
ncbi:hypothetical protein JVU11DRAFT_965 [Chiua virens]|nr:hypothetical protein JVU11DRAFT_965 [Chiua virens]